MKQSLSLLFLAVFFLSCGGSDAKLKDAASVRNAIQAKKQELAAIEAEIKDLQKLLGQLDTTIREDKRVLVSTKAVPLKNFASFVEVQGNLNTAAEPAMASSETGGRLIELLVKEGDYVKDGQRIGKVNLESVQKSIAEIDKALELATDIFERQEGLWKQKIGSEVQYLQAKNQVESLQTSRARLEYELQKAEIYAPANGYVDKVLVKEGEVCGPGSPIIMILNTNALKVEAAVPENYLKNIKKGEQVQVRFPALDLEQTVRISDIGRTIDPANRSFDVEARVDSRNGLLKPNLLAILMFKDYEKKDAVVLPQELILQDVTGRNYVMIKKDERAERRFVELGKSYRNEVVIESGLDGSERILVKGARLAADGDLLEVIEREDAKEKELAEELGAEEQN